MPQSLPDLEQRREGIAQRIAELGDLRPGSITGTSGRCGKPECHCHQPGQRVTAPISAQMFGAADKVLRPRPGVFLRCKRKGKRQPSSVIPASQDHLLSWGQFRGPLSRHPLKLTDGGSCA
jgi:hypothetical protein